LLLDEKVMQFEGLLPQSIPIMLVKSNANQIIANMYLTSAF